MTVVVNESAINDTIFARLQPLVNAYPAAVRLLRDGHLHEKGVVGDWFSLSGSMNLTFNGVFVNEEHLVYSCNPARVAERRVNLELRWGES